MKIRKRDGTVAEVSDGYILTDGETLVVGAMFMDSRSMIHDGNGGPVGQRPGYLVSDSKADEAVRTTAYRMYDDAISQRWRGDRWQSPSKPAPSAPQSFGTGNAAVAAAHAQYRADLEARWRK
jgi:hypothetical protein